MFGCTLFGAAFERLGGRHLQGLVTLAILSLSSSMVCPSAAWAMDDASSPPLFQMSLEELLDLPVQVSSATSGSVLENPSSVQVIEHSTIEAHGFTNLADALSTVAGLHLYNTNFTRDMVTARGALQFNYVNKVLIMIDGVPVWEPSSGDGVLNRLSIADVERIEVLKGPASVRYGTNAYSGSVNLVLKKRATSGVDARMGLGYANRFDTGARAFYRKGKLGVMAAINQTTERRRPYDFPQLNDGMPYRFREEYEYKSATVAVDYGAHRLLLNHFDNQFPFLGVQVNRASGAGLARQFQGTLVNYSFDATLSDRWVLRGNAAYEYYTRENFRDPERRFILQGRSQRWFAGFSATRHVADWLNLEVGADGGLLHGIGLEERSFADNVVTNDYGLSGRTQWHGSGFGFMNFVYRPIHLTLGSRYTHAQGFGGDLDVGLC